MCLGVAQVRVRVVAVKRVRLGDSDGEAASPQGQAGQARHIRLFHRSRRSPSLSCGYYGDDQA